MITDRLFKNELFTLLTQEQTHESFFEKEVHGRSSEPELSEEARQHLARWHMPEQGFRNYWYPVMLAKDLSHGPGAAPFVGRRYCLLARRRQSARDRRPLPAPRRKPIARPRSLSRVRHSELPLPRLDF